MASAGNKQATGKYGTYIFAFLTVLAIVIRIINGKYQEGYGLLFIWVIITLSPVVLLIFFRPVSSGYLSILGYSVVAFASCFLLQPLFWAFGGIGYIPFYTYSLFAFVPVVLLLIWTVFRGPSFSGVGRQKLPPNPYRRKGVNQTPFFKEETVKQAKQLILNGKIGEALGRLLSEVEDKAIENDLTALKQQWLDFEKRRSLGMLTEESARVAMANIVHSVLSVINPGSGN